MQTPTLSDISSDRAMKKISTKKPVKSQTKKTVAAVNKKAAYTTRFVSVLTDKPQLIRHPISHPDEHPKKFKPTNKKVYEIHGIGFGKFSAFQQAGIKTIKQFVEAGIPIVSQVMNCGITRGKQIYLRGLAVYQNRVIKIQEPKRISNQPVYLDIETDLTKSTIWMIGIYISKTNEFIQLVANRPRDEKNILKDCFEILSEHRQEHIITYSGSRFDERILRARFEEEGLKHSHLIFEDILLDIKKSFAFPLKSYSLSDLASFYCYKFRHPFIDGMQVAMLYLEHSNDLTKFRDYKKLREYNEDDVRAMVGLVEHIYF